MMRGAGPLPMSEALKKALRRCESVRLSSLLPDDAMAESTHAGRLRAESVAWVEGEIGFHLPLEVLALIAIDHPVASIVTGLRGLSSVLDATEDDASPEGVDDIDGAEGRDWRCVARVYCEPLSELVNGAHGGPDRALCVEPGSKETPLPVLVLEDDRARELTTLPQLILDTISEELDRLGAKSLRAEQLAQLERWIAPVPELIDDSVRPTPLDLRRATHAQFGSGMVVGVAGSGPEARITVEFDDVGRKVVLARFLQGL